MSLMKYKLADESPKNEIMTFAQVSDGVTIMFSLLPGEKNGKVDLSTLRARREGSDEVKIDEETYKQYDFKLEDIQDAFFKGESNRDLLNQMLINATYRDLLKAEHPLFIADFETAQPIADNISEEALENEPPVLGDIPTIINAVNPMTPTRTPTVKNSGKSKAKK